MIAARLHGPHDLRVEDIAPPGKPEKDQVRIRVSAAGICGSDLHAYHHARIGDTQVKGPLIPGHEFAGVVEEAGPDALDGNWQPLRSTMRVAVDPAQPCGRCEMCAHGHPNLCPRLHFCGLYPDDGCLRERMIVPGRSCFPVPDTLDEASAALLEPLGIALHAVDLAHVRPGDTACVIGAGPIGLLIVQAARLAGADPVFVSEPLPWRLALAKRFGGVPLEGAHGDAAQTLLRATGGRGVDAVFEAAWADESVQQAAEMARPGGRLVLVGIPADDRLVMKHTPARRKGLTILFSRRMKYSYPRTIRLVEDGAINVKDLISHRFPLAAAPDAFALNSEYRSPVVKVIIDI